MEEVLKEQISVCDMVFSKHKEGLFQSQCKIRYNWSLKKRKNRHVLFYAENLVRKLQLEIEFRGHLKCKLPRFWPLPPTKEFPINIFKGTFLLLWVKIYFSLIFSVPTPSFLRSFWMAPVIPLHRNLKKSLT